MHVGEPNSLGLTWNRRDMYIRNGMHCNNTGSQCSYMSSQNVSLYMLIIRETTNCQFEKNETGSSKASGPQLEDLFSGFTTMQDSNQPTQLQRLARMLKFCVEQVYQLYFNTWERTTKLLIRLCGCVDWSAPLMFACSYVLFSLDTLH